NFCAMTHTIIIYIFFQAEDDIRDRHSKEVDEWTRRDPITRMRTYLRSEGALTEDLEAQYQTDAEDVAAALRDAMGQQPDIQPLDLFDHVYSVQTPQLAEQRAQLAEELARDAHTDDTSA